MRAHPYNSYLFTIVLVRLRVLNNINAAAHPVYKIILHKMVHMQTTSDIFQGGS